jgi:UDP-N-acetylmuramoylalanine--D-glutamate ligase
MNIDQLKNKKIAVLGAGVEGVSTFNFLKTHSLDVELLDEAEPVGNPGEGGRFGKDAFKNLSDFDVVFRSPGIPFLRDEIQEFRRSGGVVTSHMKLFFELCPCPIIGITGTKGKGTTASLVFEILKESGKDLPDGRQGVYLGGNIGTPPLGFLDQLNKDSIVVLELSSFQLQDMEKSSADAEAMAGKPHIAVMLMTTSEHLDKHKDVTEYVDAKRNIFRFQNPEDFAIVNRDYPASNESDVETNGKVFYVSRERSGADGVFARDGALWMQVKGAEKKIIDTKDILLPGKHNWENAAAASMAAFLAGAEREDIVEVLKTFKGLEHRLELVREVGGVRYYDDSFSTTPETAIAAIEAFEVPKILILGGSSKNADFTELGKVISNAKNIKAIIGIGDEWWRIKSQISNLKSRILIVEDAKDMKTVVLAASRIATPGDVVLLSPACASFGMFKNYKDRGEQFRAEVEKL